MVSDGPVPGRLPDPERVPFEPVNEGTGVGDAQEDALELEAVTGEPSLECVEETE